MLNPVDSEKQIFINVGGISEASDKMDPSLCMTSYVVVISPETVCSSILASKRDAITNKSITPPW